VTSLVIAPRADAEWPLEVVAHVLLVATGPGEDDDDDDDDTGGGGGGGGGGNIDPDDDDEGDSDDEEDDEDEDPLWAGLRGAGNSVSLRRSNVCYNPIRAVTCE
jgi:hypothetical protein